MWSNIKMMVLISMYHGWECIAFSTLLEGVLWTHTLQCMLVKGICGCPMAANLPEELLAGAAGCIYKPNQSGCATDGHGCQVAGADRVCIRVARGHALGMERERAPGQSLPQAAVPHCSPRRVPVSLRFQAFLWETRQSRTT